MEAGKFWAALAPMATAFQPELVMYTDCDWFGKAPRDHEDCSSQYPLVGLVQTLMVVSPRTARQKNPANKRMRTVFIIPAIALRSFEQPESHLHRRLSEV